jgi:NADP-reducing hydrogenase subunit HndB
MKSLEELKEIRDRVQTEMSLRKDLSNKTRVVVGMATCGIAAGAPRC